MRIPRTHRLSPLETKLLNAVQDLNRQKWILGSFIRPKYFKKAQALLLGKVWHEKQKADD
jgi:hypothetical protein